MRLRLLALALLCASSAAAHDMDCKGRPVSDEMKHSCCGDHDWLRLQPGSWRQEGSIYFVLLDGRWEPVVDRDGKALAPLPSDDGCDYVWYRRQNANGLTPDDENTHKGSGQIFFYCLQLSLAF